VSVGYAVLAFVVDADVLSKVLSVPDVVAAPPAQAENAHISEARTRKRAIIFFIALTTFIYLL
jgi:hypothetical protein